MELSKNSQSIVPSAIRKIFNKSLAYENVVNFTLGEPDFTASENVVKAGCEAIHSGKTKYSANAGILPLREAIAKQLFLNTGNSYNPDTEITITTGGMGALYLTLKSILNPGDEVIVCEPYWTNYIQQVRMCESVPVLVVCKEENSFMLNVDDLKKVITEKTKAIILNSPSNPTGSVFDHNTLADIVKIAISHNLFVLSDEVYRTIVFDGCKCESISSFEQMKERTIVVNSFSKGYAMTGWRVGYAAGPQSVIGTVTKLQENVNACAAMPCQYAALEAINGSQEYNHYMVEQYKLRRDYMVRRLNQIPGISCKSPKGTFYAFVNIKDLHMSSEEFAYTLLDSKQVAVVPGTAFGEGGEGYIRMSYATSLEEIEKGLDLITEFVNAY